MSLKINPEQAFEHIHVWIIKWFFFLTHEKLYSSPPKIQRPTKKALFVSFPHMRYKKKAHLESHSPFLFANRQNY